MKIVFSPAISAAAWAIGQSLLPRGFTIEILAQEPERRIRQMEQADFLMGFLGKLAQALGQRLCQHRARRTRRAAAVGGARVALTTQQSKSKA